MRLRFLALLLKYSPAHLVLIRTQGFLCFVESTSDSPQSRSVVMTELKSELKSKKPAVCGARDCLAGQEIMEREYFRRGEIRERESLGKDEALRAELRY